eukprot:403358431
MSGLNNTSTSQGTNQDLMNSMNQSTAAQIIRIIQGNVILKRKSLYVKRFAKVENHIFQYKKDPKDSKIRAQLDLRLAKVKKSQRQTQEANYIQISLNKDAILIAFEDPNEFDRWCNCIEFNQKTDEQQRDFERLRSQQSMTPSSNEGRPYLGNQQQQQMFDTEGNQSEMNRLNTTSRAKTIKAEKVATRFTKDSLNENDLKQAKQRLSESNSKNWVLINGKEGSLIYADKRVETSSQKLILEDLKNTEILREKLNFKSKTQVLILLIVFALIISLDFLQNLNLNPNLLIITKLVLGVSAIGILGIQLTSSSKHDRKQLIKQLTESFNVKSVSYVIASPDEVANALTDEKMRQLWDPSLKSIEKTGENNYKLIYTSADQSQVLSESISFSFVQDIATQSYFIQEKINGGTHYRYYELQQVQNRPYFLRVIFHAQITPQMFAIRGKDSYRAVNFMRNWISQSNRSQPMQLVFTKNEDNVNEIFASLRDSAFNQYLEGDDDSDLEDEGDIVISNDNNLNESAMLKSQQKSNESIPEERKSQQPSARPSEKILIDTSVKKGWSNDDYSHEIIADGKLVEVLSVQNWEERIETGRYKQQNIQYLRMALAKFDDYERQITLAEWKSLVEDKKEGLNIWQRTNSNGLKCMKAVAVIERSPEQIIKVIGDSKYRNDYDPVYDYSTFLEKVADQTFIVYQKTKKVAVVSSRDFVFCLHINKMPDGTIYALVFSIDRDDMKPPEKGTVRGWLQLGGWKLQPMPDNPNKTLTTYQTEIDMKGSIPGFVMTQANKDIGYQIVKLRKTVEKYLRENP